MNNQTNPQQNRIFKLEDGRELTTIPIAENTWAVREPIAAIVLTDKEQMKAEAFGYVLSKVLIVKEKLIQGFTATEIYKQGICARSTVYKYKEILEIPPVKDTKKQVKYTQNTEYSSCVFPILLINNNLCLQTPIVQYFLFFLLLSGIYIYLRQRYDIWLKEYQAHKDEAGKLHFQFTNVCNLSYRREPIVVNSKIEGRYYKAMLKHFNNQRRDVFVMEKMLGESPSQHWDRKEKFIALYTSANLDMIDYGRDNLKVFWEDIEQQGLLDFLYSPVRPNWEESREFLYKSIQYLIDNPRPYTGDRARQKFLMNLVPTKDNIKDIELILDVNELEPETETI